MIENSKINLLYEIVKINYFLFVIRIRSNYIMSRKELLAAGVQCLDQIINEYGKLGKKQRKRKWVVGDQ